MKSTNSIHRANLATAIAGFAAFFIPTAHAQQSATAPMREIYCTSGRTERHQHRYVADKQGIMLFNTATDRRTATSFSKSLDDLQQQYNAPEVVQFFEKAQKNLDGYFWAILTQRVASEHSYPCVFRYREALEDAHKHKWNSARTKIEEAKIEPKDLNQHACVADIWIASALINKAIGSDQDALSDLRLVYENRKANPQSWTENSDIFHVPSYVRFP